jgi:hypothetical protein
MMQVPETFLETDSISPVITGFLPLELAASWRVNTATIYFPE